MPVNKGGLAFSPDGSRLLAPYADSTARIYPTTGEGFFRVAAGKLGK